MLEWVYTNRVCSLPDFTAQEALDLLKLSDRWILRDLKKLCEYRLMRLMSVSNIALILHATEEYDAKRLKHAATQYIMANIKEVTADGNFQEEMKKHPHLCMPILQEAASLIPERPPAKKIKVDEENIIEGA